MHNVLMSYVHNAPHTLSRVSNVQELIMPKDTVGICHAPPYEQDTEFGGRTIWSEESKCTPSNEIYHLNLLSELTK